MTIYFITRKMLNFEVINRVLDLTGCVEVKDSEFENNDTLEILKIGPTLTKLGVRAFYGCKNLKEIDFSGSILEEIPVYCFAECHTIETLTFPKNIHTIGEYSFHVTANPHELKKITIKGAHTIGIFSFHTAIKLESIHISDEIQTINFSPFVFPGQVPKNEVTYVTCSENVGNYFRDVYPTYTVHVRTFS